MSFHLDAFWQFCYTTIEPSLNSTFQMRRSLERRLLATALKVIPSCQNFDLGLSVMINEAKLRSVNMKLSRGPI